MLVGTDDWGYSFPGWFANCGVYIFQHTCMDNDLHCLFGIQAVWPGSHEMVWHKDASGMRFDVYRSKSC